MPFNDAKEFDFRLRYAPTANTPGVASPAPGAAPAPAPARGYETGGNYAGNYAAPTMPQFEQPKTFQEWGRETFGHLPDDTPIDLRMVQSMYGDYVAQFQRGQEMRARYTGMTPFQSANLDVQRRRLEADQLPQAITPYQQESLDIRRQELDARKQPRPMNAYEEALMRYKEDELGHRQAELAHRVERFQAESGEAASKPLTEWDTDQLLRSYALVGDEAYLDDMDPEMSAFQKALKAELVRRTGGTPTNVANQTTAPVQPSATAGNDEVVTVIWKATGEQITGPKSALADYQEGVDYEIP
jgi:hypothetical protein